MPLNDRQKRAYQHKADFYRVTRTVNSGTGKPGAETVSIAFKNVQCRYEFTDNISDPMSFGRVKRPTIFTTDILHMDAAQEIQDGWYVVDRSLVGGGRSPNYGTVHRVLGAPHANPSQGRRLSNKKSVQISSVETPPAGIVI